MQADEILAERYERIAIEVGIAASKAVAYSKVDAQTVINASYIPCPIIKDKIEQFFSFNLQKQKNAPIHAVINTCIILPLSKWNTPKRADEPTTAIISLWLMLFIFS